MVAEEDWQPALLNLPLERCNTLVIVATSKACKNLYFRWSGKGFSTGCTPVYKTIQTTDWDINTDAINWCMRQPVISISPLSSLSTSFYVCPPHYPSKSLSLGEKVTDIDGSPTDEHSIIFQTVVSLYIKLCSLRSSTEQSWEQQRSMNAFINIWNTFWQPDYWLSNPLVTTLSNKRASPTLSNH